MLKPDAMQKVKNAKAYLKKERACLQRMRTGSFCVVRPAAMLLSGEGSESAWQRKEGYDPKAGLSIVKFFVRLKLIDYERGF